MIWIKRFFTFLLFAVFIVPAVFRISARILESGPVEAHLPIEGRLVETTMGRIFVLEAGPVDGKPVLLAHGTAAWSGIWQKSMAALAVGGYRAIAFDMPPFGYSDRAGNGDYTRITQARRLNALVDALAARPILVAHSFGAGPGVEAVMQKPENYAGLIIVDGALGLGKTPGEGRVAALPVFVAEHLVSMSITNPLLMRSLLAYFVHVKEAATPELARLLRAPMRRGGTTESFAQWLPTLIGAAPDGLSMDPENYRNLRVPTHLIWGQEDTVTPPAQGVSLAELIPDSSLVMLENIGHIPQIENPDAFNRVLIRVIQSMKSEQAGQI